jgi:NitT/TauT family transport system substrate-binding protein
MSARFRWIAVAAMLALAMAVASCGDDGDDSGAATSGAGSREQMREVNIGYTPVGEQVLLKVAEQQGIFEKHGIKVTFLRAAPTGAGQIAQALNGQIDVGIASVTGVMNAAASNVPVHVVSALAKDFEKDGTTAYTTIVPGDSPVRRFKDLEGKALAVNSLKGNWEITAREAIAQDGGDPSKVKVVAIPFADQVAALKSGRVDAISTLQPFGSQLEASGFRNIGDAQAMAMGAPDSVASITFMAKKFTDENPEAAKGWVDALTEAAKFGNENPDVIRKVMIAETQLPADLINAVPIPSFTAAIGPDTIEAWNGLLVKHGVLKEPVPVENVLWSGAPAP